MTLGAVIHFVYITTMNVTKQLGGLFQIALADGAARPLRCRTERNVMDTTGQLSDQYLRIFHVLFTCMEKRLIAAPFDHP